MLEPVTIDQLRVFVAVVETGSFSAAARELQRAQSAVSQAIATLENQLGVSLFDRSARRPTLTRDGAVLVENARDVIGRARSLRDRARALAGGVEASITVAVSMLVPRDVLIETLRGFEIEFPNTDLRLLAQEARGPVDSVLSGRAALGVTGAYSLRDDDVLERAKLGTVPVVAVAAVGHELAGVMGEPMRSDEICSFRQLVSTGESEAASMRPLARRIWLVADQELRRALVLSGFGWAVMPRHTVADDLHNERMVALRLDQLGSDPVESVIALRLPGRSPGPASRWLVDALRDGLEG